MKIPIIEYNIYYPLYSKEMIQLDISKWENEYIEISIPVDIENNNIDKYNKSSPYYNDICSITDSDNGVDLILSDRKKKFQDNNMTLCEEDCDLIEYNYITKKATCKCNIKIKMPIIDEIKLDKNKLLKSFSDIHTIFNIKILKCGKNLLNNEYLKKIMV